MSTLIDLTKKVTINLEKKGITATNTPVVRVGFAIDVSGSMGGLFSDGTVQSVTKRIMAVANKFDDNGELDVWTFNNSGHHQTAATPADFDDYISKTLGRNPADGGTSYAPVAKKIIEYYAPKKGVFGSIFGKKDEASKLPAYVIFMTDGANDDRAAADNVFNEAQNLPIYWQFVGLGQSNFSYIEEVADRLPTAGFCSFPDITRTTDDQIFSSLLNDEFVGWVKKFAK